MTFETSLTIKKNTLIRIYRFFTLVVFLTTGFIKPHRKINALKEAFFNDIY